MLYVNPRLPHGFSFVYELLINAFTISPPENHKFIIRIEEIFHPQIWIHFSICYGKSKTWLGHQVVPHLLSKPNWDLVLPSCLKALLFYTPPVYAMIRNNFRIIELDYLPIHHPSLFLFTLRQSQTRFFWHHHNIVIRLL